MKKMILRLSAFSLLLSMLLVFPACGLKPEDSRTVLKFDGKKINYDIYRYVFMNSKRDLDNGDESYWVNNIDGQIELAQNVLEVLKKNRAIEDMAKKYGISLTGDKKKEIDDKIEEYKKSCDSKEEYIASLEEQYFTEYSFRYYLELSQLWGDLYDYVTDEASGIILADDETLLADIPVNFRRIKYILISNDEGEDKDGNYALAEEAYEKAMNGGDFDALIREYCEDGNMLSRVEEGYYYTIGEIIESVEEAAEELEENEIGDILETSYGYFIIERLPLQQEHIDNNLEDFRESYTARIFNEMLSEYMDSYRVEYTDLYKTLTVYSLH